MYSTSAGEADAHASRGRGRDSGSISGEREKLARVRWGGGGEGRCHGVVARYCVAFVEGKSVRIGMGVVLYVYV